jgi:hypothetical protein
MSDRHTGLSHDLPEYVPNLPLAADLRRQVRHKAKVRKLYGGWTWTHDCGPHILTTAAPSWRWALSDALTHLKGC